MMENRPDTGQDNEPAQRATPDAAKPMVLGKVLRAKRESLGFSIADVANQIKFAPRQIESLEADDFQNLPKSAFLRGFVRSYAKILQLDAETLLLTLPQNKAPATELRVPKSVGVPFPNAHSLFRPNMVLLAAAGLVAIVAVGFAMWNYVSPRTHEAAVKVETPLALPPDTADITTVPDVGEHQPASATSDESKDAAVRTELAAPNTPKESRIGADIAPAGSIVAKPATKSEVKVEGNTTTLTRTEPVAVPAPTAKEAAKPVSPGLGLPIKPGVKAEANSQIKSAEKAQSKPVPAAAIESVKKPAAVTDIQSLNKPLAPAANQSGNAADISKLRLEFDKESWTEIRDRDDNIISSQVNQPGSVLVVRGRAPLKMLIGHGLSVRLFYEGKQVDLSSYINKYSEVAHVTLQ